METKKECEACKKCEQALKEKKDDAIHYCLECEDKKKLEKQLKKLNVL
jgi:hypothetical protein